VRHAVLIGIEHLWFGAAIEQVRAVGQEPIRQQQSERDPGLDVAPAAVAGPEGRQGRLQRSQVIVLGPETVTIRFAHRHDHRIGIGAEPTVAASGRRRDTILVETGKRLASQDWLVVDTEVDTRPAPSIRLRSRSRTCSSSDGGRGDPAVASQSACFCRRH